eukprot:TRINITY_DN31127_c0_g1_i1.p2 TRINITY_DN31127_c0_g1~~TRINITY_DN31127_c0_g1_i1.p2  ORF type:complete len:182 (+),score=32.82 TRINITY_DN31127_c0_g1_i1:43-588(+)
MTMARGRMLAALLCLLLQEAAAQYGCMRCSQRMSSDVCEKQGDSCDHEDCEWDSDDLECRDVSSLAGVATAMIIFGALCCLFILCCVVWWFYLGGVAAASSQRSEVLVAPVGAYHQLPNGQPYYAPPIVGVPVLGAPMAPGSVPPPPPADAVPPAPADRDNPPTPTAPPRRGSQVSVECCN